MFGVPIVYFFIPPPTEEREDRYLADTLRPVSELYAAVLGQEGHLNELDERLAAIGLTSPEEAEQTLTSIWGPGRRRTITGTRTSAPGANDDCSPSPATTATASTTSPNSSSPSASNSEASDPRHTYR